MVNYDYEVRIPMITLGRIDEWRSFNHLQTSKQAIPPPHLLLHIVLVHCIAGN